MRNLNIIWLDILMIWLFFNLAQWIWTFINIHLLIHLLVLLQILWNLRWLNTLKSFNGYFFRFLKPPKNVLEKSFFLLFFFFFFFFYFFIIFNFSFIFTFCFHLQFIGFFFFIHLFQIFILHFLLWYWNLFLWFLT